MHGLIVVLAVVAVPAAGASSALAAPQDQPLRVTVGATGDGAGVVAEDQVATAKARQSTLAWNDTAALLPDTAAADSALVAQSQLAAPKMTYAETAPREELARGPPYPLGTA